MKSGNHILLEQFPTREAFARHMEQAAVVPVGIRILADTETPVSVLARFADRHPHLFLLESVEGGERWGRYSFMSLSARTTINVFAGAVVVRQGIQEKRIPHHGDPLEVLRKLMAAYRTAPMPDLPRFYGGLMGYFAYEMAHFFEPRVPNTLPPEAVLAELVIPDMLLIFDNQTHSVTVLALAFKEDGPDAGALYTEALHRVQDFLKEWIRPLTHQPNPEQVPLPPPRAVQPPEVFKQKVKKIKDHILDGDVIQCVLSQCFVGPAPEDRVRLYRAQRYINPSPYLFFLKTDTRTLIGSSPETMIRLDGRTASLRPIAGTRPRGATEQTDRQLADALLQDEKERAEHLMLVDLGRNELGRVAIPGTVQVTDLMRVERYSHVMHLVSTVTADMENGKDAFDVLRSAFPAGTLCGAPKIRAMELIAELEEEPRGPYGGAVGYISFDGHMDFCICIRTIVVEHGRLLIRSGAGIVADSDAEMEYQETLHKAGAMERAVELAARPPLLPENGGAV
ncbi:MAG: anthranilate synthase component I family protein [Verrucomicrobiota bacterium]|jgi:anthranilate synthase component 1|nr:anthranilate synthase component I family protein [Verrucomicrobiota bacterium]